MSGSGEKLRGLPGDDVPAALNASRLFTCYQPIVSMRDGSPFALEVLARLDHPTAGALFPSEFVPQIEDAGLARQLTDGVVRAAFADLGTHLAAVPIDLTLNFPLDVLMAAGFLDRLEQTCSKTVPQARRLILELTESQPIADLDDAQRRTLHATMQQLRALGFRLAIDDYGPLMAARHDIFDLPIDLLKLDRAVVHEPACDDLVDDAVGRSHGRGIEVIVEGIETAATWSRMRLMGVDYAQGFLISKPLAAHEVPAWHDAWPAACPPALFVQQDVIH